MDFRFLVFLEDALDVYRVQPSPHSEYCSATANRLPQAHGVSNDEGSVCAKPKDTAELD